MIELIVHIGTFKTGTTALQKFLSSNRARLLEECNLLYPEAGEIPAGGHHNLVYELTKSWKYVAQRGGFQELRKEVDEAAPEIVLLSAENLSSYALGNPGVAPAFGGFASTISARIKVICYVRPQWEYIDSYYSQGVKSGYTTCSFEDFVESSFAEDIYDYEKVILPWESVADEIVVKAYPGRKLIPEVCGLLSIFQPTAEDLKAARSKNERFGAKRLEFMRRMGAALERTRAPFKQRIPIAHKLRDAVMAADIEDVAFSGLNDMTARRIYEYYKDKNKRLSARFGMPESWCELPERGFESTDFSMNSINGVDSDVFDDVLARTFVEQVRNKISAGD